MTQEKILEKYSYLDHVLYYMEIEDTDFLMIQNKFMMGSKLNKADFKKMREIEKKHLPYND